MSRRILFEDFKKSKEVRAYKNITKRILAKGGVNFSIINNIRNKKIVSCDKNMVYEEKWQIVAHEETRILWHTRRVMCTKKWQIIERQKIVLMEFDQGGDYWEDNSNSYSKYIFVKEILYRIFPNFISICNQIPYKIRKVSENILKRERDKIEM